MHYAAVDIGTNSMRLLIASEDEEVLRLQRVTGLGRGIDVTGELSADAIERTVEVLAEYGAAIREHDVVACRAVATSASRDAANSAPFLGRVTEVLGFRPEVIAGKEEAALAFQGATSDAPGEGPFVVIDIGGGSTEFVWHQDASLEAVSVDIGSVRLTDRFLKGRPVSFERLEPAGRHVQGMFEDVRVPYGDFTAIGVAGTWTSLAAIALDLPVYDRERVHHSELNRLGVDRLVERLASLSIEQTAAIPSLDPARAPVILGGAIVARESMRTLGIPAVIVSEHDLLDGIVAGLRGGRLG